MARRRRRSGRRRDANPEPGGADSAERALRPQAVVVMGVSGSGKTTIGMRLARHLGFDFVDADRYHPRANIDKMASGVPLTDADRQPWLAALRALIEERAAEGRSLVLGCSALKRSYRQALSGPRQAGDQARGAGPRVTFIYLKGDYDALLARMRRRKGHYMKADMLASQFRDLEEPQDAVIVDVNRSLPAAVRRAIAGLAGRGVTSSPRRGRAGPGDGTDENDSDHEVDIDERTGKEDRP